MTDYAELDLEQKKKKAFETLKGADKWRVDESLKFFSIVERELEKEIRKANKKGYDFSELPEEGMPSEGEIRLFTRNDQHLKCTVTLKAKDNSYPLEYFIQAKIPEERARPLLYMLEEDESGYHCGSSPTDVAAAILKGAIVGRFE